jgi:hypothetical protein
VNPAVLAALITGGCTVVAAAVGLVAVRKPRKRSPDTLSSGLVFVDIKLAETVPSYWIQETNPHLNWYEKEARWYFKRIEFLEGTDLPLEITVMNNGANPVVVSRVGVELAAGVNIWYTGRYYGEIPIAEEIDLIGAYDVLLASEKTSAWIGMDPDEMEWYEIGEIHETILPKPIYLQPGAPLRYSLNMKKYDLQTPTHTILRMWLRTGTDEVLSDEISVIFGR